MVLTLKGLGPVPSFKNAKRIAGLKRSKTSKTTWYGSPTLITRSDVKQWLRSAVSAIASQLCSESQTRGFGTTQECLKQFVTASLPQDDGWQDLEIGSVRTEIVEPGLEGAVITIERL